MPNSTQTLQSVVDYARTIGDLMPVLPAGGYSNLLALTIANDVMTDMLAQDFNWKFNRLVVPKFYTNSYQQDYATINQQGIGWLENSVIVDINNTSMPKPIWWLRAVRDVQRTSFQFGKPSVICWLPNDQLEQGAWPGAAQTYTNPLGAIAAPANGPTNILDANNNILVLTTYGITGGVAPAAPAASASGVTVNDGTCVWTVANPKAQGFRLSPLPPQTGIVYQVCPIAQSRLVLFTSLGQLLDPLPDDYAKYFRDGFIAYCHRHSVAPVVRNRADDMKQQWIAALAAARGQGDREADEAGFIPATSIMQEGSSMPVGPAWPYGPFN